MITGRLSRYFGWKFLGAVAAVFGGALLLIAMVDFVEMLRRTSDKDISTLFVARITFYRVPFITERVMPFAVLIGAMSCYLNLSRRLELVVARAAGISAWQFIAPVLALAMIMGVLATTLYNPISAALREQSVRLEAEVFGGASSYQDYGSGFWVRQRAEDGQAIINSKASREQGRLLSGVTIFRFDPSGRFRDRIEAKSALLQSGYWRLEDAHVYANAVPPADYQTYDVRTNLTAAQVRESFATPETVPFWQLSSYIQLAENAGLAAAAYRLQYYQLLVQPFYLGSMVLLAAAVSLRFFRFGGVQKMVLSGIGGGFLLYVLAKITGDLSKAGLMPAVLAASFPVVVAGLTGVITLLYQEDG
jgi:lipopolysaccharide export system permease protein